MQLAARSSRGDAPALALPNILAAPLVAHSTRSNSCSGHGVCRMRRCECFDGWTGADCSQGAGGSKSVPPWAIALIVLSSSALAGIMIIAAGYALQALGVAPGSQGERGGTGAG